jgi:hypothetical protein
MQEQESLPYPYSGGWPIWPFTKLSEHDMAQLLRKLEQQRWDEIEEALL